jgi:hypothetical protein
VDLTVGTDAVIAKLPASLEVMQGTWLLAPYARDPATLTAYYRRVDRAGFWTACLFTVFNSVRPVMRSADIGAQPPPGGTATAPSRAEPAFVEAYGKALVPAAQGYAQLYPVAGHALDTSSGSPAATWQRMIAALRAGDGQAALDAYAPPMRAALAPVFIGRSRAELVAIADSFVTFEMTADSGEYREAAVVRNTATGRQVGLINFMRYGGRWLIESM